MNYSLSYKTKKFFWLAIKLSIVIGCGYFIYTKLTESKEIFDVDFYQKQYKKGVFSIKTVVFVCFLSFFNWFLEILKWQKLASFCKKTTFNKAAIQSLASLTASLITPNRIGEYGVKSLYFEKYLRKKIIGVNFVGNFYQLMATLFFGTLGITYFVIEQPVKINFGSIVPYAIFLFFVIFTLFFIVTSTNFIISYLRKIRDFLTKIPLNLHLKVMLFSFIRFIIFSHQFYFLLLFLHPDIQYLEAITSIGGVYLIASITPILSVFDFILKGSIAIWIFSFFNINPNTIVTITTLMWILNFAIPAIVGGYFVITFKPDFVQ